MAALIKIDHSFTAADERYDTVRFCARCGEAQGKPPREDRRLNERRICESCGMGILLRCTRTALPGARAAFLVVTHDLQISAVSMGAETIFGAEDAVIGTALLGQLTSPLGDERLGRTVSQAALRHREPVVMPARGRTDEASGAGMLAARVSTCGPPRAALVTVEPSGFGRR